MLYEQTLTQYTTGPHQSVMVLKSTVGVFQGRYDVEQAASLQKRSSFLGLAETDQVLCGQDCFMRNAASG